VDAFELLHPVSERYATLPVAHAFDWTAVGEQLGAGEWYLVAFRSIRRADADEERLTEFDALAHQEAVASPGFVFYFKGPRCADGTCLSFCLWDSRAQARAAAGKPDHVRAVGLLHEMYEHYTLEFLRVRGSGDGRPLTFEPYDPLPISA
jgi:hypothetical protein